MGGGVPSPPCIHPESSNHIRRGCFSGFAYPLPPLKQFGIQFARPPKFPFEPAKNGRGCPVLEEKRATELFSKNGRVGSPSHSPQHQMLRLAGEAGSRFH